MRYSNAYESEWRYQVAKKAKELQRELESHMIGALQAEHEQCWETMERELDEAIAFAVAHPEVLAVKAESAPVPNAAIEGGDWSDGARLQRGIEHRLATLPRARVSLERVEMTQGPCGSMLSRHCHQRTRAHM